MKNFLPTFYRCLLLLLISGAAHNVKAQLQIWDSVTNPACHGDGRMTVYVYGGTAPYTYTLTGAYGNVYGPVTQTSATFTGLNSGYYSIIVSDANNVSNITSPYTAYVYPVMNSYIGIAPAICPSTLGSEWIRVYNGSGHYTYQWSSGETTDTVNNVPMGSFYNCTVTDISNGCVSEASDSGRMYQVSSIQANVTTTPANCRNGTATVTAQNGTAPYTYLWSSGVTTTTATGLSSGFPTVTVTDAIGCTAMGYGYITQAITLTSQVNTTAEHCNDGNGTLTISPVNGTAPFIYTWSSGQTTAHITNLNAGYYSVTFTDNNGCIGYNQGQVQKSTPISLSTSATLTSCAAPTGTATVVATGGTPPYSYSWTCSPPQTTATATTLTGGYYVVNVVDAQGCFQNQSAQVGYNTNLAVGISYTDAHCGGAAGGAAVTVSGGSAPYTYQWNTGAISPTISGITNAGSYSCRVTDNAGCHMTRSTYVHSISPVSLSVSPVAASCIYTPDGSATAVAVGGTAPYTYTWTAGGSGSSVSALATGDYSVYVSDANGCADRQNFHIAYASTAPCAAIIAGDIIEDNLRNCTAQYTTLSNVWVSCLPGGGYQWTQNGHYNFTLPPGTYTVYEAPPVNYTLACPSTSPTLTLTAGQSSLNNDFYNQPDTARDLAITCIPYTPPVHGFTQHSKLIIRNLGNISLGPDVVYKHALDINFNLASPAPDSYDPVTGTLRWSRPVLSATNTDQIDLYFDIPAPLPIGHILNNSDTVYPITDDVDTFNNYEDAQELVVGSYDPNYVDVLPKGLGTPGYITTTLDTTLRYVVHFQNTGTYPASFVTLKLPIDNNLDLSTFQFIGASHTVTSISADASRMLTIRFDNIHLVDSSVSQLGSQGFAAFTLRQKKGLNLGNVINEQANIYFDFNTPVATNTTLNTIYDPNGIKEVSMSNLGLYPNPATGNVTLDISSIAEDKVQIHAYDMMGRLALEVPSTDIAGKKKLELNTAALPAGVYTIEVSGQSRYVAKLVKTDK